ncbi:MAG: adenylate/guanylate cyclase domain-containing protein [Polyangiales bacterium]
MRTARSAPVILCVDDEPIVLRSLREQFERELQGYEVEVAEDADEALEILDGLQADGVQVPVVVSDHIMPGMKGDELLVRVHERLHDTRTILLTGQAGLDAVARAINGADLYRYITKPWDREDLTLTVREAARSYLVEQQVRAQQAQLAAAHEAATRFVPYEFLSLLGRSELAEVRRGDFITRPVTVYYSDIRSYTPIIEGHTPTGNLSWINEYLLSMERPIHGQGGFVEHIAGDAICALFGTGADAGVRAAIESLRALDDLNAHRARRGAAPLRIGVGVTTGECLLGVLGGEDRLHCGVVGNAVNLAARVESLTKHLGTLLITGETRAALVDPTAYTLRYVDRVRVKGQRTPTDLYEVLDPLPAEERARKTATAEPLARALADLQAGDLAGASSRLHDLARRDPDDVALTWHLARVDEFSRDGLPTGWDGATSLRVK